MQRHSVADSRIALLVGALSLCKLQAGHRGARGKFHGLWQIRGALERAAPVLSVLARRDPWVLCLLRHPLSYMSTRWPGEIHLYAATLNDPSVFKPEAHVHWSERVPYLTVTDELPKHAGSSPGALPSQQGEKNDSL